MLTSIIVLTLNNLDQTIRCLRSIRDYTFVPYEIIVVDNGSTDGTRAWLAGQTDVKLIANWTNRGFAAACNQGVRASAGELILLLNNDTVVSHRWLPQLQAALLASDGVGIVGPCSNFVLPMQRVDAGFRSEAEIHAYCQTFNQHRPSKWRDVTALSGFCMLLRRRTWDLLGGLDEAYGIGGYEDIDIGYAALRAGLALRIAGDTFVFHEGSRSFAANDLDTYAIATANRRHFLRKYRFNPERLIWAVDPAFLPGNDHAAHPHHAPRTQEIPSGWYAMEPGGSVYRIEHGRKRPVVSADTLRRLKVPRHRLASGMHALLARLPLGEPVNARSWPRGYPDVFLARDPSVGMYLVSHGLRHPIHDEASFLALGFRWEDAVSLSYAELHALHEGWPIRGSVWEEHELIDNRVYRGPSGGLYYGEGQRLRPIPNVAALHKYGWRAEDAVPIPADVFARIPQCFAIP